MKKKVPLTDSPKYVKFMASRDRALELLLQKYLNHMGAVVASLEHRTLDAATVMGAKGLSPYDLKKKRADFEKRLDPWFHMAAEETLALMTRLRRSTYALSYLGHTEAIARTLDKFTPTRLTGKDLDEVASSDSPFGGKIRHRLELYYSRLLRDVLDAFQMAQVMATDGDPESASSMLDRIRRAFPTSRPDTRPSKAMAKMREAAAFRGPIPGMAGGSGGGQRVDVASSASDESLSFTSGVIEPAEWNQILEDYFSEQFPEGSPNRTPYSRVYYSESDATDEGRYGWEVERDVTEDFVRQVRDGENDAANAQGITDFQWIAIVDSKTDDCCLWRDALTSAEIQAELESGDHSDDECTAIMAPAHFYCRCRNAPMTDDIPNVESSDLPSFEEYLAAQAAKAA